MNLWIYGANIIFLLFAICVLLWLKTRFEDDLESTLSETAALFPRNILGDPDNARMEFKQWEDRAHVVSQTQFIQRVYLTKLLRSDSKDREVVVYPFYFSAEHGTRKPDEVLSDIRKVPLQDQEGPFGALYFELDLSPIQSVRTAIWTLALLLTLALVAMTIRVWTQEKALTKTSIELEEKIRQLVRLERLSLVGQLTANIFHDVRKPILNIRHEMEDLTETLGKFAAASKGLRNIREQVDLFFAMLRDLNLERFVSSRDEESEYVELDKLVAQACRLVQYERGLVDLEIIADADLPLVLAPPYRLIQVFSNLTLNAYQAMAGKGKLKITLKRDDDVVKVDVTDSGPGIPASSLPLVFTPFFSTKGDDEGTGLGLYIGKEIVEELGGEIRVQSSEGLGATFSVILPAAKAG